MQNKLFAILITALLVMLMAGSAMCEPNGCEGTYDSSVTLENKDSSWAIIEGDGISALVEYNASGETFDWRVTGTMPNAGGYYLIYYADKPDRFVDWGGDNPGARIGEIHASNPNGVGIIDHHACGSTELDMNLPCCPDANMNASEYNYTESDGYENANGAKLWLVPRSDYDEPELTDWNPTSYLFETDLIWYDDTGLAPIIETTWAIWDSPYQAGDTMEITARVCDYDGVGDLEDMKVVINLTAYGVEEITTLELDEVIDCVSANYTASVVLTVATDEEVSEDVIATDPSGLNDSLAIWFYVEPGQCAYMELRNCGNCGKDPAEDLGTVALTQISNCNTKDYPKWWTHCDKFDAYMIRYKVHVYDVYGNHMGGIGCADCCNGFTTAYTGVDDSLKFCEDDGSKITIINTNNPGETTLTVHCLDNDIPSISQTVEFLNPVAALVVTSNVDELYETDGCREYDIFNISAQIVDVLDNPIMMPRVPVRLYIDNAAEYMEECTDENGVATFEIYQDDLVVGDDVTFRAWSECHEELLTLDVVYAELDRVDVYTQYDTLEFGETSWINYTTWTDHGTDACYNGAVVTATLGTIDGINFTAGDVEGIAVITLNVSGVIGTAEIVINGIDCEDIGATPTQGIDQTIYSGTVSASWNFTGNGTVCVQALGDPIPEWDNDTKGAFVHVTSDDINDSVTLDLNGTGDTWMLNDTTWEFYAAGDTSEVGLGINQMFALVYDEPAPDPDPEPTPTATTSKSSRGGGGGGTYPPDPVPTPTPNATDNETDQDDPKPAATKAADVKPTVNLPGGDTTLDTTPDDEDDAPDGTDPTSAIFIVLGIMALIVIGYVIYRKSQQ